ncbi:MAG: transglutaminase-like putative cysteine protease [Myxococcota bacterium]|jgi:transglutaminase-like putative cysteine protease
MRELVEALIRSIRYPLWVVVAAAAALCLVSPFTDGYGQVAAVLGALSGGLAGELLGRSRLRGIWLLLLALAGALALAVLDRLLVGWWPVATTLGPVVALHLGTVVAFGGGGLVGVGLLRALGRRGSGGRALELGVAAAAIASAFAPHRDGAIARPLWLSDRAWEAGLDPVSLILAVGVLLGIGLPLLMLLESRRRLPLLAPFLLPLLVLMAFFWTDPATLQTPPQVSELDNIQDGYAGGQGENDEWESSGGGGGGAQGGAGGQGDQQGSQGGTDQQPGGPGGDQPAGSQGGSSDDTGQQSESGEEGSSAGNPQESLEEGGGGGEPTPVAIVILGDDYAPPNEAFYLRQEPHSQYNGLRLVRATGDIRDEDTLDHFAVSRTALPEPPSGHRARVQGTVSLLVEHTAPFGIEAPTEFWPTRNPSPGRFVRTYGFSSLAQDTPYEQLLGFSAGDPAWSPERWAHYTEGPVDPRYRELALRLIAELPAEIRNDPFAQALKIKLYLDENMKYTRSARHAEADDPTADFLFGDLIGYCVHSAHASVFLWRSLGLPARIGTGYLVQEEQRRGSALMVRDDQAHAWPELYLDDLGWVVLDVAPSENLDPPSDPVDDDLLAALADLAREQEEASQQDPIDYALLWQRLLRTAQILVLAIIVLVLSSHYTIKAWRRLRPLLSGARSTPRVGYRVALDRLAEAGLSREQGETREDFARRMSVVTPSFEDMTALHLKAALGRPGQPVDVARWLSVMAAVRREVRSGTRWWRRLLGWLNPFSFYRAR